MKKMNLCIAMMLAMVCAAQAQTTYRHISPIQAVVTRVNLDTLRANSASETVLLSQLEQAKNIQAADKKALSADAKAFKLEKKLYKAHINVLKSRSKQVKAQKKFYNKEARQYEKYIRVIDKQQKSLIKLDGNLVAVREQRHLLDGMQRRYDEARRRSLDILGNLESRDEVEIKAGYEAMGDYLLELTDKETQLKNMQMQNKTDQSVIKAEIKNTKTQLKNKK